MPQQKKKSLSAAAIPNIGDLIGVWWKKNKFYFAGTVVAQTADSLVVSYVDGDWGIEKIKDLKYIPDVKYGKRVFQADLRQEFRDSNNNVLYIKSSAGIIPAVVDALAKAKLEDAKTRANVRKSKDGAEITTSAPKPAITAEIQTETTHTLSPTQQFKPTKNHEPTIAIGTKSVFNAENKISSLAQVYAVDSTSTPRAIRTNPYAFNHEEKINTILSAAKAIEAAENAKASGVIYNNPSFLPMMQFSSNIYTQNMTSMPVDAPCFANLPTNPSSSSSSSSSSSKTISVMKFMEKVGINPTNATLNSSSSSLMQLTMGQEYEYPNAAEKVMPTIPKEAAASASAIPRLLSTQHSIDLNESAKRAKLNTSGSSSSTVTTFSSSSANNSRPMTVEDESAALDKQIARMQNEMEQLKKRRQELKDLENLAVDLEKSYDQTDASMQKAVTVIKEVRDDIKLLATSINKYKSVAKVESVGASMKATPVIFSKTFAQKKAKQEKSHGLLTIEVDKLAAALNGNNSVTQNVPAAAAVAPASNFAHRI